MKKGSPRTAAALELLAVKNTISEAYFDEIRMEKSTNGLNAQKGGEEAISWTKVAYHAYLLCIVSIVFFILTFCSFVK